MKKIIGFILLLGLHSVYCKTNWASKARLIDRDEYIVKLLTATVASMGEYEWSNFKIDDYTQEISERMYNWHVNGTVEYKNGFLISVQNIDVTKISSTISKLSASNTTRAMIRLVLGLNHARIGYDIVAKIIDQPTQHFTGEFGYKHIQMLFNIGYNFNYKNYTITAEFETIRGEAHEKMDYMPRNSLTEVLSRVYEHSSIADSVEDWAIDIISPMILDAAQHKVPFPEVCFYCS